MSIECPACGKKLAQITNTHVKHKHPEFNNLMEFRAYYNISSTWSTETKEKFIAIQTGKTRGPYNWTDNARLGWEKAALSRSGNNHWNFGQHWSAEDKEKISKGVRASEKHLLYVEYQQTAEYKERLLQTMELRIKSQFNTRVSNNLAIPSEYKVEFEKYSNLVKGITQAQMKRYSNWVDPNNLKAKGYQVDHMVSRYHGFMYGINPIIIGSIANLMMLPKNINRDKWLRSSISIETLNRRYLIFLAYRARYTSKSQKRWETEAVKVTSVRCFSNDVGFDFYNLSNDLRLLIPDISTLFVTKP